MKLNEYVGKLMAHTPKAIKNGSPADRIYSVVGTVKDEGEEWLLAWKLTLLPNGKLKHPAFKRPLSPGDQKLFVVGRQKSGSVPTAMFRPDSYYKEVKL